MKIVANIAGALLGLIFVASGVVYFLKLVPMPEFPAGSPVALFFGAFYPTGYLDFVKALEILGGLFVAIPRLRNAGLLILGPILINIIAFHAFVAGEGVFDPPLLVIAGLTAFVLWTRRRAFAALVG